MLRFFLTILLPLSAAATGAVADSPPPDTAVPGAGAGVLPNPPLTVAMVRTEAAPVIDGVLDDDVWALAPVITNFTQVLPKEGGEPSERTELRLLYDSHNLYIGVRCFDSRPDTIVAAQMQRSISLNTDDHITIVIDPFDKARAGYEFQVSAAGGMRDGLVETDADTNYDWRGQWAARVTRDELGWIAEIAIPFKTISFDAQAPRWGFNLERWIRRTNEQIRWASPLRNTSLRRLSAAGSLTGMENLQQGLGLTIKPFLRAEYDAHRHSTQLKPGFDLFYSLTPSSTLALTVNTDFAETDVDEVIVNLTRFPTFFPEKRDFFLQDAGVFEFGGIARSPRPFFSRRIGIVRGEEKDILAGLKFTGRHEDLRFGLMNVQMKDDDALGSKNLTVARAAIDVLEESSLGFIVTHGDPATRDGNTLAGIDFNYLHRDQFTGNRVTGNFWLMGTYTDPDGRAAGNTDSIAFGARIGMPNEPWRWHLGHQFIGRDFNPALGFVQRTDRRVYDGEVAYRWRPKDSSHWVRALDVGVDGEVWTFPDNQIEQARFTLPRITLDTRTNEQFFGQVFYDYEKLVEPFQIVRGVFVPTGTYDTVGIRGGFRTNTSKPFALRLEAGHRSFYTGHRNDLLVRIRLRPSPHFSGGFEWERAEVDLDHASFSVHILRAFANVIFTPRLSWNNIVQWDNQSENITANSRIRWEFQPGQEIFLVYNESMLTADQQFRSVGRKAIVKLGMTFHF